MHFFRKLSSGVALRFVNIRPARIAGQRAVPVSAKNFSAASGRRDIR